MKGNLLIVDDEPLLLKILSHSLGPLSDQLFIANDGMEALKIFSQEDIHCIVCDINMPELSGVEVLKAIRSQGSKVPLIFYSGHGNAQLKEEAMCHGAFDFLQKPMLDGIEDIVERALKLGIQP